MFMLLGSACPRPRQNRKGLNFQTRNSSKDIDPSCLVLVICAGIQHARGAILRLRGGAGKFSNGGQRSSVLPNFSPPLNVAYAERTGVHMPPGNDSVERTIEIDATPDEVFRIASGFEDYPVGCLVLGSPFSDVQI
jgi:hypothetical protein